MSTPSDFGCTPREVHDRFVRYVDVEEYETLKVLSAADVWDRSLFEHLITHFNTSYPTGRLGALYRYSFVQPVEGADVDPHWTLHALMREALAGHDEDGQIQRVHRHLFELYDAELKQVNPRAITDTQRRALRNAVSHALHVIAPEAIHTWYHAAERPFHRAAAWRFLIPIREEVTEAIETTLGPDPPDVATTLNNLAALYRAQGRCAEAEPLFERSLSIVESQLGPDHPYVATTLNNLAGLYRAQGRYAEAEPLFERSVAICTEALGEDHPHSETVRENYKGFLDAWRQARKE